MIETGLYFALNVLSLIKFFVVIQVRFVARHVDCTGLASTAILVIQMKPYGLALLEEIGDEVYSL